MGTTGGMGEECKQFQSNLAAKLAQKDNESYPPTMNWLRTKLSFKISKSVILSMRG